MTQEQDDTVDERQQVAFRCACGADVLLEIGGTGECEECGRAIHLGKLDPSQTVSFCAEIGSGTSFQLTDGPDRTGESLGHFRLMSKLGWGGMGAVYRALDESLQRFVAVKVIRSSDTDAPTSRKLINRLLDEAVAQARLNHPNVVTIYYVGREGEEPFFAMELLPGPTLAQLIEDEPLPYTDLIHYARQVVSALSHANRLGLVHGDIKPSNLILAGDRRVKLSDFGLAQSKDTEPQKGLSGTISYMAPELSRGGFPTAQSDMYSLGVTLFELAFGRRPYAVTGTTLKEQIQSKRQAEVEFPDRWPTNVPNRFRDVLERLLQRDPEERFESFEELDKALHDIVPVGVTPASLVVRSFAMIVDYAILAFFMLPFVYAIANPGMPTTQMLLWLCPLTLLIPLVASLIERSGRRTPGRYLLQLRIADRHGLRLEGASRMWRSLIRNAPITLTAMGLSFLSYNLDIVAALLSPLDELVLLVNMLPALGSQRLALHDRIVGSRVVLDTMDRDTGE
ncbi:MAG: protein kinase [Planctomycetota bacterium]